MEENLKRLSEIGLADTVVDYNYCAYCGEFTVVINANGVRGEIHNENPHPLGLDNCRGDFLVGNC